MAVTGYVDVENGIEFVVEDINFILVQRDFLHGDVCRLATGSNTIPFQLFYIYFTYIWFLFNIYITDGAGSNTILFHLFNSFEFGAYFGWFGLNLEASRHFKF